MKRSAIRSEIERILNTNNSSCYIDSRSNNCYRMKIVRSKRLTEDERSEITKLPNVLKVKQSSEKLSLWCSGVSITFNCRPKNITL